MVVFPRKLITFHTLLSPDQCVKNLSAAIGKSYWYGMQPVLGTIHKDEFRIQKRHIYFGYAFGPLFYGTWHEDATGTFIEGHFGLHPIIGTIAVVMLVAINGVWILLSSAIGSPIFLVVASLSICWILVAQLFISREKTYLQEFLKRTLQARRVDARKY